MVIWLYRLFPYVSGTLMALFLAFPRVYIEQLGPIKHLVTAFLFLVFVLSLTALMLIKAFPKNPVIREVEAPPLTEDIVYIIHAYREAGFELVDPALEVELGTTATIWILPSPEISAWASVFRTGSIPTKVGYDVFSVFQGECGGLTSVAIAEAWCPLGPGDLKQAFPGATPVQLIEHHMGAIERLRNCGIQFEIPQPNRAKESLIASMKHQRKIVFDNPVKTLFLVLWRTLTKQTPFLGKVDKQPNYETTIAYLKASRLP